MSGTQVSQDSFCLGCGTQGSSHSYLQLCCMLLPSYFALEKRQADSVPEGRIHASDIELNQQTNITCAKFSMTHSFMNTSLKFQLWCKW